MARFRDELIYALYRVEKKIASALLAALIASPLLPFAAFAQFVVTPGTPPAHIDPNRLMAPGKIFIDTTSLTTARYSFGTYNVFVAPCVDTLANCTAGGWTPVTTTPGSDTDPIAGGALRIGCPPHHFNFDDPLVWNGLAGRTHLHLFYGSDITSPRNIDPTTTGGSTCDGGLANRTRYWAPPPVYHCPNAALTGCDATRNGQVFFPKSQGNLPNIVYYKSGEPPQYANESALIWPPAGMVMIAGVSTSTALQTAGAHYGFNCNDNTTTPYPDSRFYGRLPTTEEANAYDLCNEQNFFVAFPNCLNDAMALDSPDHNSHLQFRIVDVAHPGFLVCPTGFSNAIPNISLNIHYRIPKPDLNYTRLSSDPPEQYGNTQTSADTSHIKLGAGEPATADWYKYGMLFIGGVGHEIESYDGTTKIATMTSAFGSLPSPGTAYAVRQPGGLTIHADWVNGWDQTTIVSGTGKSVTQIILDQCLRVLINCGTSNLGDPNPSHDHNSTPSAVWWYYMSDGGAHGH